MHTPGRRGAEGWGKTQPWHHIWLCIRLPAPAIYVDVQQEAVAGRGWRLHVLLGHSLQVFMMQRSGGFTPVTPPVLSCRRIGTVVRRPAVRVRSARRPGELTPEEMEHLLLRLESDDVEYYELKVQHLGGSGGSIILANQSCKHWEQWCAVSWEAAGRPPPSVAPSFWL